MTASSHTRTVYNDAQLIELTMTTCFFNYFARFCQGSGLPLEPWTRKLPNALQKPETAGDDLPRIALASDPELQMAAKLDIIPQNAGVLVFAILTLI